MEKRMLPRTHTQVPIACCCFTISEGANFIQGTMLNCSPGGTYIELDRPYKEGTILMIKTDNRRDSPAHGNAIEGLRTISLAEVKWAKAIEKEKASQFGLGLKYYDL
ncbi:PilZ domain-containing protein [Desulfatitalea tepidiphila]|uniref:PilZ domain-containing protein n=1 Tax=Desulfatitalea tepidiphila TaxID=1185843 RepID=UPI0006B459A5|nr:PilZ domain-containing protein [Desulfatitalea tepidiphila]